jgi:hypothetical protein
VLSVVTNRVFKAEEQRRYIDVNTGVSVQIGGTMGTIKAQLYLAKCTDTKGYGRLGVAEQRIMTVPNGVSYLKRLYKYKAIIK